MSSWSLVHARSSLTSRPMRLREDDPAHGPAGRAQFVAAVNDDPPDRRNADTRTRTGNLGLMKTEGDEEPQALTARVERGLERTSNGSDEENLDWSFVHSAW